MSVYVSDMRKVKYMPNFNLPDDPDMEDRQPLYVEGDLVKLAGERQQQVFKVISSRESLSGYLYVVESLDGAVQMIVDEDTELDQDGVDMPSSIVFGPLPELVAWVVEKLKAAGAAKPDASLVLAYLELSLEFTFYSMPSLEKVDMILNPVGGPYSF